MSHQILVSGASGFIASHAIERLLAVGHDVVGTVRNPDHREKNAHLYAMKNAEKNLTLVAAELTGPDPCGSHVDLDYIMHMASPYVLHVKDPECNLVDPAVKGTVSLLKAAAKSKRVKRVVLTSSMAAVTDEPDGRVLTEADSSGLGSYLRSHLGRVPRFDNAKIKRDFSIDFMSPEDSLRETLEDLSKWGHIPAPQG